MLLHGELPFPSQLVLDVWHIVIKVRLSRLFFLFGGADSDLRTHSLAEVIESEGGYPHEVAVDFQWPAILIVDEDADGETLHLFGLEHTGKALI